MNKIWINRIWLLFWLLICFFLSWCWSSWSKNELVIDIPWYELNYQWNVMLSKVALKTDDLEEIIDLYQEEWDDIWYRDSLLIAQRYWQWLWINTFVEENLDTLENNNLTISNINKKQLILGNDPEDVNAVLVEYEITEWFIEEVPKLYVSQLFIPDWSMVILMSYITENQSSRSSMSNAFKQIK